MYRLYRCMWYFKVMIPYTVIISSFSLKDSWFTVTTLFLIFYKLFKHQQEPSRYRNVFSIHSLFCLACLKPPSMIPLFAYGTLLYSDIQLKIINRVCKGRAAILYNYKRSQVKQQFYPGIIAKRNATVEGYLIYLNEEELLLIDDYEGNDYKRATVSVMCDMNMIPVFTYVFIDESKLEGNWLLEIDRMSCNRLVVSQNIELPLKCKYKQKLNDGDVVFTFPRLSLNRTYTTKVIIVDAIPNYLDTLELDPWQYFNASSLEKQFTIFFTKESHISLNLADMISLGCKNDDHVEVKMTYGTFYLQVQLNHDLVSSNCIKLPCRFSDFILVNDPLKLVKITPVPIISMELVVITPVSTAELEILDKMLLHQIISQKNPIFLVNTYYFKWKTLLPHSPSSHFIITKSSKVSIFKNQDLLPFKFKNSLFCRSLQESINSNITIVVYGHTEQVRLEFIKRNKKYSAQSFIKINFNATTLEHLINAIDTCVLTKKCLLITHLVVDDSKLDQLDLIKAFSKIKCSTLFSIDSVATLSKLNIEPHLCTEIDQYNKELVTRLQQKTYKQLPKSIFYLNTCELLELTYRCYQEMLSSILYGKRTEYDTELFLIDFDVILQQLQLALKNKTKIPKVQWKDIGGLEHVKDKIINCVELPLRYPELFKNKKQSGILLFGPPGTGKTLVAKAIATECELNFKSIKGPELLNQYIGESESNIRKLFQEAKQMAPCVLFFDELDALAPKRGVHSDSGGVMDRLVSQLLNELDGISQLLGIVVIGATNRPDLLDPALTRPGRFDNMIYLGPCEEKQQVLLILQAQLSKYTTMDLSDIADQLPLPITGADLFGFTGSALQHAIDRMIKNNIDDTVMLQLIDFEHALRQYSPSLTIKDMKQYDLLKAMER